ncbi:MAG: AraC family transcriptional regulator [Thermoanaerobaculia bacterium]
MNPDPIESTHTFGSVLRGLNFDGLSVEEVLMPEGLVVPEHLHDGAQIYFVLEGTYVETLGGRPNLLRPGAAWFRPPRERHENAVVGDEAAMTLIVTFDGSRFASVERRCSAARRLQSLLLDDVRREIVREMHRADPLTVMALEGWALLLLSHTARLIGADENATPEWLGDAVQYIERAYAGHLSLASVAAHVGVHPATLAAAFRRFHGTSVGQFIRDLRLRRARTALVESRRPIKEIAVDAGFYDQAHFGRLFKQKFGVSPAALRSVSTELRDS